MLRRVAAPLVLCLLLAGCGGGGDESTESSKATPSTAPAPKLIRRNPANASTTLTIGSKNFTEEFILGEIYAQALKAGGYKVRKQLDYGSELVAFKGVRDGKLDAYPEYTGTALTTFFGVEPDEIPKDEQEAYEAAKAGFAKSGVTALPPTPVHRLQRRRHDPRARRGAGRRDDLRPQEARAHADALGLARVPPAAGLQARAGAHLRAALQALPADASCPTATRC